MAEQSIKWGGKILKYEFSYSKIEFLDLEISISEGFLKTNLFVKPSNQQLFLDFHSDHPSHCKEAIPYSQALRVVERCGSPEDRDEHLGKLRNKFLERSYPPALIDKQFERAKSKERKSLIYQNRKDK